MQIPCLSVADIELPREVEKLYEMAYNFWWAWNPRARRLFSAIDGVAWTYYRNPVELLINVEPDHWESLTESETFMTTYDSLVAEFTHYMSNRDEAWFAQKYGPDHPAKIAYFSMEYGVHESFAGYSGGLGVLSGDHLKSASDLGLPLVAVGLLYRRGYFNQTVDADGWQQHTYANYDFTRLPVRPIAGPTGRQVLITVPFPGRDITAKLWLAQVGRVPLVLLDTDIRQNEPSDRPIGSILYVRGREMRICQELLLGVGGVKALRALGIEPTVWHLNEGHSTFLQLERMREFMEDSGSEFDAALESVHDSTVFTTHTPVPAGNEVFDRDLACKYMEPWSKALGVGCQGLLDLGNADHGESGQPFNLTAFALRTSRYANGVSKLHAQVSNEMWNHVFPEGHRDGSPVDSITNGVHTGSWIGMDLLELFNRRLGLRWKDMLLSEEDWRALEDVPDEEVWAAHQAQKSRLGRFARVRLRSQFARHGHSPDELRRLEDWFDTDTLTIGFARRFATYKRADLLFRDLHRLRLLVKNSERPVQIVMAGKAHPADRPGQELIRHIFELTQSEDLLGRVFFLEDYDMRVGRALVQGVDLWLNTPIRPQEASGTSGQKAAINGALNFSVLDGWWPEAYNGNNGWCIGTDKQQTDRDVQDRADSLSLYTTLEEEIIPAYYDRDERGLPHRWIKMMKNSIATVTPLMCADRMVRDYTVYSYLPKED